MRVCCVALRALGRDCASHCQVPPPPAETRARTLKKTRSARDQEVRPLRSRPRPRPRPRPRNAEQKSTALKNPHACATSGRKGATRRGAFTKKLCSAAVRWIERAIGAGGVAGIESWLSPHAGCVLVPMLEAVCHTIEFSSQKRTLTQAKNDFKSQIYKLHI